MVVSPSTLQVQTQIRLGEGKKKKARCQIPRKWPFSATKQQWERMAWAYGERGV